MLKHLFLAAVIALSLGFSCTPKTDESSKPFEVTSDTKTSAFSAEIEKGLWKVTLEPEYFVEGTEAVAVIYNDTYFGLFLLSDEIYLPIHQAEAELILSSIDINGTPLTSEIFKLWKDTPK